MKISRTSKYEVCIKNSSIRDLKKFIVLLIDIKLQLLLRQSESFKNMENAQVFNIEIIEHLQKNMRTGLFMPHIDDTLKAKLAAASKNKIGELRFFCNTLEKFSSQSVYIRKINLL